MQKKIECRFSMVPPWRQLTVIYSGQAGMFSSWRGSGNRTFDIGPIDSGLWMNYESSDYQVYLEALLFCRLRRSQPLLMQLSLLTMLKARL